MADQTTRAERCLINHLPAASPDWAWRWLYGDQRRSRPWQGEAETRRQLTKLAGRYERLPLDHALWARLDNADPPPLELWLAGQLPPPPYLTVVGPRRPSASARRLVEQVVRRLAPHVTVVSGLARGIDTLALTTALEAQGRVLAIVPTGLDEAVATDRGLIKQILRQNGVLAERLFISHLSKSHFLYRNRLLAGVADALYVPEAGERSGTFNTITHALKMGVDVLVSPGDVSLTTTTGSNRLIQEGAAVVLRAADVAAALGLKLPAEELSPLLEALANGSGSAEDVASRLGWNLSRTIRELVVAQSDGSVARDSLGRYRLLAGDR